MLQIKKLSYLSSVKYSLQFLFKLKDINKKYRLKKSISSSIILRSPKHFNIGKQKILSLNYKVLGLDARFNNKFFFTSILKNTSSLFKILDRSSEKNVYLSTKSLKITLNSKFTITWLEF